MDDRQKTLAAVAIIIGFIVLVILVVGALVSGKKVVSPVPEESAIKIIFVSPTVAATASATPKETATPTPTPKPKPKPTATPTPQAATPTPTLGVTPTATATPAP